MKEAFIIWITLQLIIMGVGTADTLNKMTDGTYECHSEQHVSLFIAGLIPLAVFMEDFTDDYCANNP